VGGIARAPGGADQAAQSVKPGALRIGSILVAAPFVLAPMAGYTDAAMRWLCRRFGCGLTLTEVANAEGIARGCKRSLHLLETLPGERPIGAHIYGAEPDRMAEAAAVIAAMGRFDFIDVNCGCPTRKIVAKGAGAALTRRPDQIEAIVRAIRGAVALPVTVKTRTGFSLAHQNISEIAHAVEQGGAAAIFIHARVALNRHNGAADWQALARVKRERGIPVIGNGGVTVAADALRMIEATGVDGVMVGRAAVGHPWIFGEMRALFSGQPWPPLAAEACLAVIAQHLDLLAALKAMERRYRRSGSLPVEQAAVLHFRGHLARYLSGLRGWGEVRRHFSAIETRQDVMAAARRVLLEEPVLTAAERQ
jgi:tRNA-dihydrouridine synthase B